jgi:hypothetical protein
MRCAVCGLEVDPSTAHWAHEDDCPRPSTEADVCGCDRYCHPACCTEPGCQPRPLSESRWDPWHHGRVVTDETKRAQILLPDHLDLFDVLAGPMWATVVCRSCRDVLPWGDRVRINAHVAEGCPSKQLDLFAAEAS